MKAEVWKAAVKKGNARPFYEQLAAESGTYRTWNFHKYLIGRDGKLIAQFSPRTQPYDEELLGSIKTALKNQGILIHASK